MKGGKGLPVAKAGAAKGGKPKAGAKAPPFPKGGGKGMKKK